MPLQKYNLFMAKQPLPCLDKSKRKQSFMEKRLLNFPCAPEGMRQALAVYFLSSFLARTVNDIVFTKFLCHQSKVTAQLPLLCILCRWMCLRGTFKLNRALVYRKMYLFEKS